MVPATSLAVTTWADVEVQEARLRHAVALEAPAHIALQHPALPSIVYAPRQYMQRRFPRLQDSLIG